MTREEVVEEVAEAEMALGEFFDSYTEADFVEMNERLRVLHNEAVSLQMPTTKIEELKLRVASAIGKAPAGPEPWKPRCRRCEREVESMGSLRWGHCGDCLAVPGVQEQAEGAQVMSPQPPQPSAEDREQAVKDLFS